MAERYQMTVIGEASVPAPRITIEGQQLQDGARVHVDMPTAVALIEAGLAVACSKVEIEAVLKPRRGAGVMIDGRGCFAGDTIEVDWSTARNLVARGRARLAEGVRLPRFNPDARK